MAHYRRMTGLNLPDYNSRIAALQEQGPDCFMCDAPTADREMIGQTRHQPVARLYIDALATQGLKAKYVPRTLRPDEIVIDTCEDHETAAATVLELAPLGLPPSNLVRLLTNKVD